VKNTNQKGAGTCHKPHALKGGGLCSLLPGGAQHNRLYDGSPTAYLLGYQAGKETAEPPTVFANVFGER
jgi:hypothetical protein